MGVASSLFFSPNDREKQTLHRRITPTDDQYEEQKERWNALADYLLADLKEQSGCGMRHWLQGSYKLETQVRPPRLGEEFDIDLGIYFEWEGNAEDGNHSPKGLKNMVQQSLLDYPAEDVVEVAIPPKERCARIRFKGDFHIDVPSYHLAPERDARMLATEADEWEDSDPKAFYVWFIDFLDEQRRAKARRHVRYVKCWSGQKFRNGDGRPSSMLLTVLVVEAIDELAEDELAADDEALRDLLHVIVDRLEADPKVPNPANRDEILSNRLDAAQFAAFLDGLREFRKIAIAAVAEKDAFSAADTWSRAFGHFFPLPEIEELAKAAELGARLPVRVITPEIAVRAVERNNPRHVWQDDNQIGPIPRDCDIFFEVINRHEIPDNAVIEWTVRNEGDEAEDINDLGHRAGIGFTAQEHSRYKGVHYMDCVVRQYGRIVGMRRVRVTIHGFFMPRRNPARKPGYVRLR